MCAVSACLIQGKLPVIKTRDQRVILGEHMLIQTRRCDLKILLLNISVDICVNHVLAFRVNAAFPREGVAAPNSRL